MVGQEADGAVSVVFHLRQRRGQRAVRWGGGLFGEFLRKAPGVLRLESVVRGGILLGTQGGTRSQRRQSGRRSGDELTSVQRTHSVIGERRLIDRDAPAGQASAADQVPSRVAGQTFRLTIV